MAGLGLLHRNKHELTQWELPGGKVDEGESAAETAVRELYEELGVSVKIDRHIGNGSFTNPSGGVCEYSWFLATIVKETPSLQEPETFDDFGYFSVEELGNLKLSGNMQEFLRQLRDGAISIT